MYLFLGKAYSIHHILRTVFLSFGNLSLLSMFQYFIAEQASYMYSMAIVPLYDTLGAEACSFIINQGKFPRIYIYM